MKRFIITTIFTLTAFASIWAKPAKLDTLYYDKDWKPVSIATFASYYRVYEISTNTTSAKPFRDYYITGEIYADGKFISIDKENDDLSVFTDDMVIYYKSGKIAKKMSYKNGKLEGNYTEYFDNGLIALNTSYKNGIEDGTRTEFKENGESFTQVDIENGKPKYDYYYASNKDGEFSKLYLADNSPVWEQPSISDCEVIYRDGTKWLCYTNNGIGITSTVSKVNEQYGKWWTVEIVIANKSAVPIEVNPEFFKAEFIQRRKYDAHVDGKWTKIYKEKTIDLDVLTFEDYMRKVKRQQNWQAVAQAIGSASTAMSAGWSVSQTKTTSMTNAHASAYGGAVGYATNGNTAVVGAAAGYAKGNYSGTNTTTSTTVSYDAAAAYQTHILMQNEWRNMARQFEYDRNVRQEGYLKRNTIYPGEVVKGYINVEYKKIKDSFLTCEFIIDEIPYTFQYDVAKKKNKKK